MRSTSSTVVSPVTGTGTLYGLRGHNLRSRSLTGFGQLEGGATVGVVILGVAAVGLTIGLFIWFWGSIFRIAREKL